MNPFQTTIGQNYFWTLLLIFCGFSGFSQDAYTVSGVVQDSENEQAVVMATVSLLDKDSTLVTGTTTDMDGGFKLKNVQTGNYFIRVQYLGYGTYYEGIEVDQSIQMEVIELSEEAQTLEEVNISAYRSTGKQKGDTTQDRKSTRLNSSHVAISYAVFCLKKKKTTQRLDVMLGCQ